MSAPRKLMIGCATANGMMSAAHVTSLVALTEALREAGIATRYRTVSGPNLDLQRDLLADALLASDATHLLLIDADIGFAPDLGLRLLAHGHRVVGVPLPRAAPDFGKLAAGIAAHGPQAAYALAHEWNVRFAERRITVEKGLCRVASIEPALMLVAREALTALAACEPAGSYRLHPTRPPIRAFFRDLPPEGTFADRLIEPPGEGFCRRLAQAGIALWADVGGGAHRVQEFAHGLPFLRVIEPAAAEQAAREP